MRTNCGLCYHYETIKGRRGANRGDNMSKKPTFLTLKNNRPATARAKSTPPRTIKEVSIAV